MTGGESGSVQSVIARSACEGSHDNEAGEQETGFGQQREQLWRSALAGNGFACLDARVNYIYSLLTLSHGAILFPHLSIPVAARWANCGVRTASFRCAPPRCPAVYPCGGDF